jgi:hypothetical protein
MKLDMQKLEPLLGTMVNELGAAANAALVLIGDKLGLYTALAEKGPMTSEELAAETGTHERYVREWLSAQAASGFVTYNAGTGAFELTPEQEAVFANADSPVNPMTSGPCGLSLSPLKIEADELGFWKRLRHDDGRRAVTAADIRHPGALFEPVGHAVQGREPFRDEVALVAGSEEPLGAAEQAIAVLAPAYPFAALERL